MKQETENTKFLIKFPLFKQVLFEIKEKNVAE